MKVTFIGGGSFRIVGEFRELLRIPDLMQEAEVALYDLDRERVEAMAKVIATAPGVKEMNVSVTAPEDLDTALKGADFVEVTPAPWNWDLHTRSCRVCLDHGFNGSDNVSISGAYLALRGGPMVLDVARRMEKVAPTATMLIFTNPVPLLAGIVNRGTSIRAIGICAGQRGHFWDVPRVMGWDPPCYDLQADVAGVNHMSWIMGLRMNGKDILPDLNAKFESGVDTERLAKGDPDWGHMNYMFLHLIDAHRMCGHMLFSIEGDGLPHTNFYQENLERYKDYKAAADNRSASHRRAGVDALIELASKPLPDDFWTKADGPGWGRDFHPRAATGVRIMKGLATDEPEEVPASYLNNGAVNNFPDDIVIEHTLRCANGEIGTSDRYPYSLPQGTYGVSRALVEHQTLAGKAVIEESPRTFKQAIYEYPMARDIRNVESFMKEMLEVNRAEMPAWLV